MKINEGSSKPVRVRQSTIDRMRAMGMGKALEHANSGTADAEFTEGARRFYGKRVTGKTAPPAAAAAPAAAPAASAPAPKPKGNAAGSSVVGANNARALAGALARTGRGAGKVGNALGAADAALGKKTKGVRHAIGRFWDKNVGKGLS